MNCTRPGVLSGGLAHNSAGTKSVIAVPHPLLPTHRKRLLYSRLWSATELKVAEGVASAPATRYAGWSSEDCMGAPRARIRLEASRLSRTLAAVSVFCFGVLLSPKAFVTDATLRSTARKNCLQRDLGDMSAVNNLLFFSKLHS